MKKELVKILVRHADEIASARLKMKELVNTMAFCQRHKFLEEERIARVKYDAMSLWVSMWEDMYDEIKDLTKGIVKS